MPRSSHGASSWETRNAGSWSASSASPPPAGSPGYLPPSGDDDDLVVQQGRDVEGGPAVARREPFVPSRDEPLEAPPRHARVEPHADHQWPDGDQLVDRRPPRPGDGQVDQVED